MAATAIDKELTLYVAAHGLELGSDKPLKSTKFKKYNTFLTKSLILYEQGCSGLVNRGNTEIAAFYAAFQEGKEKDTKDVLESVAFVLRDKKCKMFGPSASRISLRQRDIKTRFKRIIDSKSLYIFVSILSDKLKNYSEVAGKGQISTKPLLQSYKLYELVATNDFLNFCKLLSDHLVKGIDYAVFMGLFSMAIEEFEPNPKFAEDLFKCSLYSSYKLAKLVNDKKFFMSGKDETKDFKAYMNYGIYLIDTRGVGDGSTPVINLLEKNDYFKLREDNTIYLSDILKGCFKSGFDKVNIIDNSCRLLSNADDDLIEGISGVLDTLEMHKLDTFTEEMRKMNYDEKKSNKRKSMFRKKKIKSLKKSISRVKNNVKVNSQVVF